jgi:MFS transporter, YNFM family, putative membrane transport protein
MNETGRNDGDSGRAPARLGLVLFAGGFVTFSLLYSVQPLLPAFSTEFALAPATVSLTLSMTTAALALGMLVAAPLSESFGRTSVMKTALVAASLLALAVPLCGPFRILLLVRALLGFALSGVPAVAMTYLSEEVPHSKAGAAIGFFISGNAIGGMSGRILTGFLTDQFGWRVALLVLAVISLATSVWFVIHLPPSRRFEPRPVDLQSWLGSFRSSVADPALVCLYAIAFVLMGSFVSLYNYITFLLMGPPFRLSHAEVSWVFFLYLVGTFSSPWGGRLGDRYGRRRVLWIAIAVQLLGAVWTLAPGLSMKILGTGIFTFGFFAAHALAGSWVGLRALTNNGAASALYLFTYYVGSSLAGTVGGIFWSKGGWPGVVGMIGALLSIGIALSLRLTAIPPLTRNPERV